jgi:hypothetical protein
VSLWSRQSQTGEIKHTRASRRHVRKIQTQKENGGIRNKEIKEDTQTNRK